MKSRYVVLGSALLALSAAACARGDEGRTPVFESRSTVDSAHTAPVGQRVVVRLQKALGTDVSYAGDQFTARLAAPIMADDGGELVPAGAAVQGSVAGITVRPPSLTLRFDSVHTADGDAPLDAMVLSVRGGDFGVKDASSVTNEGRFSTLMRKVDVGSVPTPADTAPIDASREELRIPADTTLELMLSKPLKVFRR